MITASVLKGLSEVVACDLTRKTTWSVSFGWMLWNFLDQFYFSTSVPLRHLGNLPAFWYRTVWWKVQRISSENNCDEVLFQSSCRLWLNWKKDFITVSLEWMFCEIFQISFIVKHLRVNTTAPFRSLWDFTCVLKEVTEFIQVNLDGCSCTALQKQ